jgi:localization factor PodJL
MARVTERINQRQERASTDLLDRMRQSEERTARLLEEARERIDRRLTDTQKGLADPARTITSPPTAPARADSAPPVVQQDPFAGTPFAEGYDPFASAPFSERPSTSRSGPAAGESAPMPSEPDDFRGADFIAHEFRANEFRGNEFEDEHFASAPYGASAAAEPFPAAFPSEQDPPAFAAEDFDAAQAFSHDASAYEPIGATEPEPAAPAADFDSAATRSASTRELIAAARAPARPAAQPPEKEAKANAGGGGPFGRFGKKRDNSVRNALLASGAVALLGVSAASYVLYRPDLIAGWSKGADKGSSAPHTSISALPAAPAPDSGPIAANLTTDMAPPTQDNGVGAAAVSNDDSDLYNQAKDKIKANDPSGLDMMRKAANLGYAPAQFYLAKLYEDGDAGVKKDPVEARRWTERAATGGDPKAMHNLGLYYFHGDGGVKNVAVAATWFRRAADLGLVDSQYNLAQLYEQGLGVSQNPAEAYKWFLIAAKAGDGESKASAERLKQQLSVSAQDAAERAASAFRTESAAPVQTAAATPAAADANLALAQKALSKLGYYKGPTDGANSPALRLAIASYQKTLGQAADGTLNPDLIAKFNAITLKSDSQG